MPSLRASATIYGPAPDRCPNDAKTLGITSRSVTPYGRGPCNCGSCLGDRLQRVPPERMSDRCCAWVNCVMRPPTTRFWCPGNQRRLSACDAPSVVLVDGLAWDGPLGRPEAAYFITSSLDGDSRRTERTPGHVPGSCKQGLASEKEVEKRTTRARALSHPGTTVP